MQYSQLADNDWSASQSSKLKQLLACEDVRLIAASGGGNSKVFCVEANNEKWAVKSYPPHQSGQRDRLSAELTTYQFLNKYQVPAVPLLKTYCSTERWLVMNWVEGSVPGHYSEKEVDQAIQFIRAITQLNLLPEAREQLPQAAEACLSLTILINQIQQRFQRLIALPEQDQELNDFLSAVFAPALAQCSQQAIQGYRSCNLDPDSELPWEKRSLIPADFGFHNTIRDATGKLYFFDFDYFGWDDPIKLLADILWHPKMHLSEQQEQQFIHGLAEIYSKDALFLSRFSYGYPLFGLRWVLILLNEFIPEYWRNRQHAGAHQDQDQAKKMQLERAKALLMKVQRMRYSYENISTTSL